MGNRSSTSRPEGAKPLSGDLKKYTDHSADSLLVVNKCLSDMAVKIDNNISNLMTNDERVNFTNLLKRKELLVDQIDMFVLKENRRYKGILAAVAKGERHMHQLFKNSGAEAQIAICEDLVLKLTDLRHDFKAFHDELKHAMSMDGRMNSKYARDITKWMAALTFVGGAIACVALVICHFVPGVNVTLGAVEITVACVGSAALLGTALIVALTPDEVDRALAYINNLVVNLQSMKESLMQLQVDNVVLADEEVYCFLEIIESLVKRTDNITALCSHARA